MDNREIKTIGFGRACREKLGMYLSSEPQEALYLGLREIYVNSLDALTETKQVAGLIEIIIKTAEHSVTIKDDGPGIPNKTRSDGIHSIVAAFTMAHTGSHFDGREVNSIGTNGVGGSIVNHTADYFQVISKDGTTKATAKFNGTDEGAILSKLNEAACPKSAHGLEITYNPSSTIYQGEWFSEDSLIKELSEMMKFYPKTKIILTFDNKKTVLSFPQGLKLKDTKVYYESDNLILALSLKQGETKPFGNRLYLSQGGAFFTHFKTQLTRIVNDLSGLKLNGQQVQYVFSGYVAIFVNNPLFSNQSKTAISNKEVNNEITMALKQGIEKLSKTTDWACIIKALEMEIKAEAAADRARERVKKAKDDFIKKKLSASDKFIDTDSRKRENCELYITEGLSASSTLKKVKPVNAGIMMLRGKVLNVARIDFEDVMKNEELTSLAKGLGATMTDNGFLLPAAKCRFGKVIIFADADEDGLAIEALLLTFFYKYFPRLLKEGYIYGMEPKLFGATWSKGQRFFSSETEMNKYLKDNKIAKVKISRYKGLGSYEEHEFPALISPEERVLRQFTINDAKRAQEAIALMESDMDARRALVKGEFTFYDEC